MATPYLCPDESGQGETARHVDRDAGLRMQKKRMPFCNGMDTGLNMTRPERELTSARYFVARESEEFLTR
jgi:hypothetical protein